MSKYDFFKEYDIRGILGVQINTDICYKIGRAYAEVINPKYVVVGGDSRESSIELKKALCDGLVDSGVNVLDLGLTGTEEIYFATSYLGIDGGIQITASHNPINYNGMKLVKSKSHPVSKANGLNEIKEIVIKDNFNYKRNDLTGSYKKISLLKEYVDKITSFVDFNSFVKPLKVVVNSGNGAAGHVIDYIEGLFIERKIPVEFVKLNNDPDGTFPKGIPNPLLPECREETSDAVLKYKADLGIAFDGDFDRCFFFDNNGRFVEGYYIVGLLASSFLSKNRNDKIIHDPRLLWNTVDIVNEIGGFPIQSKTGHAFIKDMMRINDAVYGGEMSAHHYFRDFYYCDSGMIPWLLIIEILSKINLSLGELLDDRMKSYPVSGEINLIVDDHFHALEKLYLKYKDLCIKIDRQDGFSFEFENWRFNIRSSNTESLIRLNVETKSDVNLLKEKVEELVSFIENIS